MNEKTKKTTGLFALYRKNPALADKLVWDREVDPVTRRGFLKKSSLLAMSSFVGASIPFAEYMPGGLIPAALADTTEPFAINGKDGLIILNDRPINAETPPHLLDDDFTPARYFFVRNNGIPPALPNIGAVDDWILEIDGESCARPARLSVAQLKQKFKHYTYALTLECGGNGRSEFYPPAKGNQWTTGAVGCAKWTGVRLRDVLEYCGIKKDAVYVGYYGADSHLSGNPKKEAISRGVPIAKALEDESLIAWAFNGEAIPYQNGFPLRLVTAGWPASTSGKWLNKIVIRNKVHDGEKMLGQSYRVPCHPVAPGSRVPDEAMCIIESMPVKSIITFPKSGGTHRLDQPFKFRGKAWAGDLEVASLAVSIDFGASWRPAKLEKPVNRLAWQKWQAELEFPGTGYYEVWAKATDSNGKAQPTIVPGWNPKGYLNNACHRIAVQVV
ncbi:MAG: sulfite oxidase [Gammaproteobacteria bacterium]